MKTGSWFSIAGTFSLLASITFMQHKVLSFAGNGSSATPDPVELLPVSNPQSPTELEQAYLDSFSILKYANKCSEFYGGSSAIAALNELTKQIQPKHLDRHIGIRMTGESTIVVSARTGFTFRLFEKAEINLDGPFYRGSAAFVRGRVPQIGPFEPNTREARATTVLHELGHLIRGRNGQWLLPNDGEDFGKSEANTRRVLDVCGEEIRALHIVSFEEELLGAQSATSPDAHAF
ncbi:MAG: hypothetical protein QOI77_328 [Blastocatellia bacterium]|jgi:hypothetical protein|nr:hypothetical protein [Blastocatellia bacterium]